MPLSCNRFYFYFYFFVSLSRREKKKKILSKNFWREDQSSHALITYENERNKMYSSVQGAVSCLAIVCVVLAAAAFIFPGNPLRLLDLCATLPDMCNIQVCCVQISFQLAQLGLFFNSISPRSILRLSTLKKIYQQVSNLFILLCAPESLFFFMFPFDHFYEGGKVWSKQDVNFVFSALLVSL